MSLTFHWFLPTYGDSRFIVGGGHGLPAGVAGGARPATLAYLGQIARTAEQLGFAGALTPTGGWCEDAWLTTAMLTEVTERLKFLVAFRPGLLSPTLAAQMAATFQRHSGGRLLLNVVVGGESHEQRAYGDWLDKDARYARADEFLHVARSLWRGGSVDFTGEHHRIEGATLPGCPTRCRPSTSAAPRRPPAPSPPDTPTCTSPGANPAQVAGKLDWIRKLAADEGRELRYGIRLHVIARDTADEAWAQARKLLDGISDDDIAAVQAGLARSESEGQKRMLALHGGKRDDLQIAPNLWAGVGLVRGGAGTALVGSHTEIADRIAEYADLGISEFILSGHPHVEEAYWFGEGVLPILRDRGLWTHPAGDPARELPKIPFAAAQSR
ncbi:LLM class flavin-dependent oxidoreductase [Catellatospora coxensis]